MKKLILSNPFAGNVKPIHIIIPTDFNLALNWVNARIPEINARIQIKIHKFAPRSSRISKLFICHERTDAPLAIFEDGWKVVPTGAALEFVKKIAISVDGNTKLLDKKY